MWQFLMLLDALLKGCSQNFSCLISDVAFCFSPVSRASYDMISGQNYSRRIYPNGGMIPKYTGYVPRK